MPEFKIYHPKYRLHSFELVYANFTSILLAVLVHEIAIHFDFGVFPVIGVSLCSAIALALLGNSKPSNTALLGVRAALVFLLTFGLGIAYYIPLHAASVRYAPLDAGLCNR